MRIDEFKGSATLELENVGIRHLPMGVLLAAEGRRYQKVLEQYPIHIKVGFSGNWFAGP